MKKPANVNKNLNSLVLIVLTNFNEMPKIGKTGPPGFELNLTSTFSGLARVTWKRKKNRAAARAWKWMCR